MALIEKLTPEVLTAIGVSFGALFGGVAALIGELRKPSKKKRDEEDMAGKQAGDTSAALLEEEVEHLTRTMWIIERRLSDHLVRIEGRLSMAEQAEEPPPQRRKPPLVPVSEERPVVGKAMRDE
jgi:hypothetical protein